MQTEKYSPELVQTYVNQLKKQYPEKDAHFLEIAVLQYLLLDCEKVELPLENDEFEKQKEIYKQKEYKTVLLE